MHNLSVMDLGNWYILLISDAGLAYKTLIIDLLWSCRNTLYSVKTKFVLKKIVVGEARNRGKIFSKILQTSRKTIEILNNFAFDVLTASNPSKFVLFSCWQKVSSFELIVTTTSMYKPCSFKVFERKESIEASQRS